MNRAVGMFVTAVPGLAELATRELDGTDGVRAVGSGFDGRSDLVLLDIDRGGHGAVLGSRLVEDVFVEVGRTRRADGDRSAAIAGRLWRPEQVERALSVWARNGGALRAALGFRVIARVLDERSFRRTDLRRDVTAAISRDRPRWRPADPAPLEVWVTEYRAGSFVAGLRLTDERMRQHDGREVERAGALRPTVAAALVGLAGEPDGLLLDPCCGSGTILAEAVAVGWAARGGDIDAEAVEIARTNVPSARVQVADARRLDLDDGTAGACVSNLPFGQQFRVPGGMDRWLGDVLAEMARVTRAGGRVVVLAPSMPAAVVPAALRPVERSRIRLLGTPTTVWVFQRR
ncbi:MAG TPA: methyltransferase domain-containing protein [Micromonosporaceae bacterium]